MCWTAPVSLALGTAGVATAAYSHKKGESKYFTIPLLYFSLMEFLQFFSYFYVNDCALSVNTTLTFFSWVHMAFQPIFVNMFLFRTVPNFPSPRIRKMIYGACLFFAGLLMIKLIPFYPQSVCTWGTICGPLWCTVSGNWHIAWSVPWYTFPIPGDAFVYYSLAAFGLPLLYGAWRGALVIVLSGPILAYFLTGGNWQEWPAVWCLYSVAIILYGVVKRYLADRSAIPKKARE